jgi:acyl-CoA thioesterase-2
MIHGNLIDLAKLLGLEPLGDNKFRGAQVTDRRSRVYGGQFLGQGLMAASQVCVGDVRSFHAYYIRPGTTQTPLTYSVQSLADNMASVQALQNDRVLFTMDVAFGDLNDAEGASNPAMPTVPPPEECITRADGIRGLDTNSDSTWAVTDSPFDYRFAENIWADDFKVAGHNVWFRGNDANQTHEALSQIMTSTLTQAMVAYFSDDPIMDNALFPHGWHRSWSELQTASLDHAMWFHAPLDLSRWTLFAQDSPSAGGGRAITRGLMFDDAGRLLASACQEILMRTPTRATS